LIGTEAPQVGETRQDHEPSPAKSSGGCTTAGSLIGTPAGQDGGEFTMTVRTGSGWARIEVSDTGTGEWNAPQGPDLDAEYGRGLAIVAALADKLGHDITAGGQTVWAEAGWTNVAE
jgi:hypothetical protein